MSYVDNQRASVRVYLPVHLLKDCEVLQRRYGVNLSTVVEQAVTELMKAEADKTAEVSSNGIV
jgi:post-segregation antitoxin (ccd killing protein)